MCSVSMDKHTEVVLLVPCVLKMFCREVEVACFESDNDNFYV